MAGCDHCQPVLLDRLFGLLEVAEATAVDAHLAGCPACAAAFADEQKAQSLIGLAAKGHFPNVTFSAPNETPTVPARPEPLDERASVGRVLTRWAVAAGLLLAVTGLAVPTAFDTVEFFDDRPRVVAGERAVASAREKLNEASQAEQKLKADLDGKLAAARTAHEELVATWVKAEKTALDAAASRPFAVEVSGPAAAVPGAPNVYAVSVRDKAGNPKPARLSAAVLADGKTVFQQTLPPAADAKLTLPADVWAKVPGGVEPVLQVTAEDPAGGPDAATVREPVRLLGRVFSTFLTTDKPLYQPGDTVYFRSTTLDRTRLLPPEQELYLRFELVGPDGTTVIDQANGQARAATQTNGKLADVLGPDGRPVRGVGCGGFDLKPDAAGGTYTLRLFELAPGQTRPPAGALPLAVRTVQVAAYRPDTLEKVLDFAASSYGSGEPVSVKLTVTDQGKPVAGAKVSAVAKLDAATPAVTADPVTAANGTATIRFALPAGKEPAVATLSVMVRRGDVVETVVRPVPLAGSKLTVEFFPEGGDLVAGLPNRVYVRAVTAAGKPADLVGVLSDGDRDVCPVATLRDADRPGANRGLGLFQFVPQPGKNYTLKLSQPAGAGEFKLPAAKPSGVTLTARDPATKPGEPIRLTLGHQGAKPQSVLVGAYLRGRAVAHARAVLAPGRTTDVTLDPGPSPLGGVVRVTAFADDDAGDGRADLRPLAERLLFRRTSESLNLSVRADKSAYLPGEAVRLTVDARTEADRPTAAVLWAAVVSNSVLKTADDRTERTLPTHFRLGAEVRMPDDLENADYLLTDQPRAAESLDLVLGTQGWRRFAEQAPEEFRTRVPAAEADRLLAAVGASAPQFVRSEVQAVADRFWPTYEVAALSLEKAEQARATGVASVESARVIAAQAYEGSRDGFKNTVSDFDAIEGRWEARRWWLIVTLPLLGLGVAGLLLRWKRADASERKWIIAGVAGLLVVAAMVVAGVLATADVGAAWRKEADTVGRNPRNRWGQTFTQVGAPMAAAPAGNRPFVDKVEGKPGPVAPKLPAAKVTAPPRAAADDGKPAARRVPAPRPPFVRQMDDSRAVLRLEGELGRHDGTDVRAANVAIRENVPRGRPLVVREYAHTPKPTADGTRSDFAETVLWKPVVVVPTAGTVTFDFHLSDAVTGYRVLVAGHTLDGRLGATTQVLEVRPPLVADPKLPLELSTADTLTVPVGLTNGTGRPLSAEVTLDVNGKPTGGKTASVAADGGRVLLALPPQPAGPVAVTASVRAPGAIDTVRRTLTVVPDGFPADGAKSERLQGKLAATVTLPGERVAGGTRVGVTVYPSALAGVMGGLDGLLREPHGCFEQASSANYPNVLALEYLRTAGGPSPRADGLMANGYRRLTGYECADTPSRARKGFEWFGAADRPHPALSAYGLLQFADMSRVFPVDPELIKRTKGYLLSLRTGDGKFFSSGKALDSFGRAPPVVTDAYIVWAVSEAERTGDKSNLTKELDATLKAAGDDPYLLALAANAALNRGRTADGVRLLEALAKKQAADGGLPGAAATITTSGPADRATETTALALLGWLKADRPDLFAGPVGKAVGYLTGRRQGGGAFGATQATVLALRALVDHARRHPAEVEAGELRLLVNGKVVATAAVRTDAAGPVSLEVPDADATFPPGTAVEVAAETTLKQAVPASLTWAARTTQPPSAADAPLTLAVSLDKTEAAEGETVRLTATVTNTTAADPGMAVAVVGLPAGLTVPADGKQLRRLVDDGKLDFWEVRGRELVLYWRGMGPKAANAVGVELVAAFPGSFRGPASRAYPYYDAARKHWLPPLAVTVR